MMLSALWGRIRGKDKKLTSPSQQTEFLGRLGDHTIISPYGLYADLPNDTLLEAVGKREAVSVTIKRPTDTAQGEPVFFHPGTNTRIIARNNGDLDIITTESTGNVNIQTVNATITASDSVTIDSPEATFTGNLQVDGDFNNDGTATLGGAGGLPIARQGDPIQVFEPKSITAGSPEHTAT